MTEPLPNPKERRTGADEAPSGHDILDAMVKALIARLESGNPTAAELMVARRLLKDFGITANPPNQRTRAAVRRRRPAH